MKYQLYILDVKKEKHCVLLLCTGAPTQPIKHNTEFFGHIDSTKSAHTSHKASLSTFHLPPVIKHIECPLTFSGNTKADWDLLFCCSNDLGTCQAKIIFIYRKRQLNPASEGAAAIETRHSLFAYD